MILGKIFGEVGSRAERLGKYALKETREAGELTKKTCLESLAENTKLLNEAELNAPIDRAISQATRDVAIGEMHSNIPLEELNRMQANNQYNNL